MKRSPFLIALLLLTSITAFIACNNSSGKSATKPIGRTMANPDSTLTIIVFRQDSASLSYAQVLRLRWDTLVYEFTDTAKNNKKALQRDSLYILTVVKPIDSATSVKENIPMLDSAGKPSLFAYKYLIPRQQVVYDCNVDLEAMIKKTIPPRDTTPANKPK
jgi:hypothetical protein